MNGVRLAVAIAAVLTMRAGHEACADAIKCKEAIAKQSAAYVQKRSKALQKCEDAKTKGKLPVMQVCTGEAKTQKVLGTLMTKLGLGIGVACGGPDKTCGTADDDPLLPTGWSPGSSCPDFGSSGCTQAIGSCADVAACIQCVADAAVGQAIALYYGSLDPGAFATGNVVNKCQQAIGKATAKFLAAKSKALQKCRNAQLMAGTANPCPDATATTIIGIAEQKKVTAICKACGGPDKLCDGTADVTPAAVGFVASCPAVSPPGAPTCAGPVDTMSELVACVDCVTEAAVDCMDALTVPEFVSPLPAECNPISTTTTTTSSTTTTLCNPFIDPNCSTTTTTVATTTTTTTVCPPGQVCSTTTTTLCTGQACVTTTTTTTTTAPSTTTTLPACGNSAPACNGTCPQAQTCVAAVGLCFCATTTTTVTTTTAPSTTTTTLCPPGQVCSTTTTTLCPGGNCNTTTTTLCTGQACVTTTTTTTTTAPSTTTTTVAPTTTTTCPFFGCTSTTTTTTAAPTTTTTLCTGQGCSTTTTTTIASTTTTTKAGGTTTSTTSSSTTTTTQCTQCGGNCVDTQTDPNNCGACGNSCNTACTGNVASTTCSAGACTISACAANHYDVDGTCGNGCECTGLITGGSACGTHDIGTIQPGASTSISGNVPQQGGEVWYQVTFTSGATPEIKFTGNPGNVYRFEVLSTCTAAISCLGGGTDCFPGTGTFQIGVKTLSSPSCSTYTLDLSNL